MFSSATSRLSCLLVVLSFSQVGFTLEPEVNFSRDILPVLSDNCFQCHGPDEANREAGLRLDRKEGAFAELESGARAVVHGKSSASSLYERISSDDPDFRMPPADSGKSLSAKEVRQIREWIDSGAEWTGHWAFQPPRKPIVPASITGWSDRGPIDRFTLQRLQTEGLAPESQARNETLIRRATLDLTGLPATLSEIDAFLGDASSGAYERVIDRLLNSARYGEHMARHWLDAARYADTHGLHFDNERSIWPYRDWVIQAFNKNLPFDQFTIQQLAGDLLPEPSLDQLVATGFNRCNVTTSEGGSIDDEYYVRYAVDRVETTTTVWLGLTAGCAACHDHKFDPLTQKEFYQLFSYFFSLTEKAMDGNALLPPPSIKVPSPKQTEFKAKLESQLADVKEVMETALDEFEYTDARVGKPLGRINKRDIVWFDDELPEGAEPSGDGEPPWQFVTSPEHPVLSGKNASLRTSDKLSQHLFQKASQKLDIGAHDRLFAYVYLDPKNPPETIQLQFNDGSWEHRAYWGADEGYGKGKTGPANHAMGDLPALGEWIRLEVPAGIVGLNAGAKLSGWAFSQFNGTAYWDKAGRVEVDSLDDERSRSLFAWEAFHKQVKFPKVSADLQKILDIQRNKRSAEQTKTLNHFFFQHIHVDGIAQFKAPLQKEADLTKDLADLEASIPSTLVMKERKEPRQAHILDRGQYTTKGEKVASRIPAWLSPQPEGAPANRLGLAQWLVDPSHPLTARVTVNRYWQHFFGTGLVKTSEDFGIQGEHPSHPALLDWLAIDFIESGWDVKRMLKMIVMSATYRQDSRVTPDKLSADPENRLLARGPRFRLDAEVIRDQALSISGLMVPTIGGKSVKPYQPAGLWKPVGFGGSNTSVFKQGTGSNLYRRSMYTFWKRTSPPPSMSTFDAPDRETCQVRRARTNTPLQALVLMNDVQFFEAARKFAERVMLDGGSTTEERITFAFRTVTARQPNRSEMMSLSRLLEECQRDLEARPEAAAKLLTTGEAPKNESLDANELGAWTMITHLLLNLSETVTKG